MENRSQFTFYASFYEALSHIKKAADRAQAYDILCQYALFGTEPDTEKLPDSVAIAYALIKPNMIASRRKAENGKRGGNRKQTGSKPEANCKQTGSKKEKEVEKEVEKEYEIEIEIEEENECSSSRGGSPPTPRTADEQKSDADRVLALYLERFPPDPSASCVQAIREFTRSLGAEVCIRAMDEAIDNGKPFWSYLRAILQDKQRRGITSLAAWDASEHSRPRRYTAPAAAEDKYAMTPEETEKNMAQLERLRRKMKGEHVDGESIER